MKILDNIVLLSVELTRTNKGFQPVFQAGQQKKLTMPKSILIFAKKRP